MTPDDKKSYTYATEAGDGIVFDGVAYEDHSRSGSHKFIRTKEEAHLFGFEDKAKRYRELAGVKPEETGLGGYMSSVDTLKSKSGKAIAEAAETIQQAEKELKELNDYKHDYEHYDYEEQKKSEVFDAVLRLKDEFGYDIGSFLSNYEGRKSYEDYKGRTNMDATTSELRNDEEYKVLMNKINNELQSASGDQAKELKRLRADMKVVGSYFTESKIEEIKRERPDRIV